MFYKDYQAYLWLVTSTEYYLEIIFENSKYIIKNNRKKVVEDIIRNYKYLQEKGYVDKDFNYLKNISHL